MFIFLGFNLSLRSQASHGLIPYMSHFDWDVIYQASLFSIYYSFILGFFLTNATVNMISVDISDILISLNPLPGNIAGWYDIAYKMVVVEGIAPSVGIGELALFPYLFAIYFLILGFVYSFVDKQILTMVHQKKMMMVLLLLFLMIMHIISSFEYNLRSSTRYIYIILYLYC
jgi:hypothetical protein